jgi:hypothetical protein
LDIEELREVIYRCKSWALAALLLAPRILSADTDTVDALKSQWTEYLAVQPKTIMELQPFRETSQIAIATTDSGPSSAQLVNLNPNINVWFILTARRAGGAGESHDDTYHLENADPRAQRIALDPSYPLGVRIWIGDQSFKCPLWGPDNPHLLEDAEASGLPYTPICEGRLFLRNAVPGTYTTLERITNLLRDHVWGGERIVQFVRKEVFQDAFVERGTAQPLSALPNQGSDGPEVPRPALLADEFEAIGVKPEHLAIDVEPPVEEFAMGRWYPVADSPGIFVSVIEPYAIAPTILRSFHESVNPFDAVEANALDYMVAFDMSRFDLGFALGTDHPRVGWSQRAPESMRDSRLPGPDGVGEVTPLVRTGMVNPSLVARTAATFAGGFKREHGAFRYGALAEQNAGSHYGFIEQGTIFSKLVPGLATLFVTDTGTVAMTTWTKLLDDRLAHIRYARQNGVPLIEVGTDGVSKPGPLVNRWGPGNWSGSSEERLRTVRAGICLQESSQFQYLIYGYFSDATPSTMARVFQAYGCNYAMHLDMNALEHTYLALYATKSAQRVVQHLIAGMEAVDRKGGGNRFAPRFIGFPDDRDFFYLLRKRGVP